MRIIESSSFSLAFAVLLAGAAAAQSPGGIGAEDRSAIEALVGRYGPALGQCRAEEFADLFVPESGYFASGFRGHMQGHRQLVELVESERHCLAPAGSPQAVRPGGSAPPAVDIEVDGDTVRGLVNLGSAEYQDEYAKTPQGWRFASRTVIIAAEKAAGLDAAALLAIQALGGPMLGDYYEQDQNGKPRLMTSGVRVTVEDGVVRGRAFLKDGSYKDETFEQTGSGAWRVAAAGQAPASTH